MFGSCFSFQKIEDDVSIDIYILIQYNFISFKMHSVIKQTYVMVCVSWNVGYLAIECWI